MPQEYQVCERTRAELERISTEQRLDVIRDRSDRLGVGVTPATTSLKVKPNTLKRHNLEGNIHLKLDFSGCYGHSSARSLVQESRTWHDIGAFINQG